MHTLSVFHTQPACNYQPADLIEGNARQQPPSTPYITSPLQRKQLKLEHQPQANVVQTSAPAPASWRPGILCHLAEPHALHLKNVLLDIVHGYCPPRPIFWNAVIKCAEGTQLRGLAYSSCPFPSFSFYSSSGRGGRGAWSNIHQMVQTSY